MDFFDFDQAFLALTGNRRLSWQKRLYVQHFEQGKLDSCSVIDIPTGLGKTMVMAIWLIARAQKARVPTRLIYVVDRRTVVDQSSDLARKLRDNCKQALGIEPPAISTLRGQLADNREWSNDASKPAIIIGTVDLIGSGLLFSGYRSSYKRRPLEAGLLGQDSLLVLDEAHLSKPFEKLLGAIQQFSTRRDSEGAVAGVKPMQVIRMSATSDDPTDSKSPFTLRFDANGTLTGEDAKDRTITDRFAAKKTLNIIPLTEKDDLRKKLAEAAIGLAQKTDLAGKRIVVFVRKPEDAKAVAKTIREHVIEFIDVSGAKPQKVKETPFGEAVEVLTGTMRGLERDELVEKPVFKERWLKGELRSDDPENQQPVFLISTSAGEVGFDLNADHLIGDAAPLDSWIQRLGRVNRRGNGDATVLLILEKEPDSRNEFDKACIEASKLLSDGMDVSPKALAAFKKKLTQVEIAAASTPRPITVELTDILLDAWSMTSITQPMPGRPEVGPWLRGIDNELPQTTIAWRAELELFKHEPSPESAFAAIFAKHRIRPHESLTTNSYRVVEFLKAVTAQKKGRPELRETRVVVKFARDLTVTTIGELIDDPGPLNADPTLILPASFGGLDSAGMLSHDAIAPVPTPDDPPLSLDVADIPGYEQNKELRARLRILIDRSEGEWKPMALPGGAAIPADLNLESSNESSTRLLNALKKADLRVRLVQPVTDDQEGDVVRSLIVLAPAPKDKKKEDQLLTEHIAAVEAQAKRIAEDLHLEDPLRSALLFAAKWHDEGKKADIWQRFVFGPDENGQPKGKAAATRDPNSLKGYRHEFGSLVRIHHPKQDIQRELPIDTDVRDLALHLIATHHGASRPHFENPFARDFRAEQCDAIHFEAIRRFARLQRRYGWWQLAWLENLLRCADALASADQEAEDDLVDSEGGKA